MTTTQIIGLLLLIAAVCLAIWLMKRIRKHPYIGMIIETADGQKRRITNANDTTITIDKPFDPPQTEYIIKGD